MKEKSERIILKEKLQKKRKKIDLIDQKLIELLEKRFTNVMQINKLKKKLNIAPLQKNRYAKMIKHRLSIASKTHLSMTFIKNIFEMIHHESVNLQKEQRKK
jgi:chorismate mutase